MDSTFSVGELKFYLKALNKIHDLKIINTTASMFARINASRLDAITTIARVLTHAAAVGGNFNGIAVNTIPRETNFATTFAANRNDNFTGMVTDATAANIAGDSKAQVKTSLDAVNAILTATATVDPNASKIKTYISSILPQHNDTLHNANTDTTINQCYAQLRAILNMYDIFYKNFDNWVNAAYQAKLTKLLKNYISVGINLLHAVNGLDNTILMNDVVSNLKSTAYITTRDLANTVGSLSYVNKTGELKYLSFPAATMKLFDKNYEYRFNTTVVRNLFFITNLNRVLRLLFEKTLTYSRNVIKHGLEFTNPSLTEYGQFPMLPNETYGSKQNNSLDRYARGDKPTDFHDSSI